MHRDVLRGDVAALVLDQHADLARRVDVGGELADRLDALEAAHGDVLADLLHQRLARRLDCLVAELRRGERLEVARARLRNELRDVLRERLEVGVLRDEIGLAVHFREARDLAVGGDVRRDHALGGDARGGLRRLRPALDAQELLGLLHVAAGFLQRLLAFHHAEPGTFPELLHHSCRDLCHFRLFHSCQEKGASAPLFRVRFAHSTAHCLSDSSTSTKSSLLEGLTISLITWLAFAYASITSFAAAPKRCFRSSIQVRSGAAGS